MMAKHSENNQSVILGMPAVLFFILAAVVLASAYLRLLPDTLLGGLALCAAVGYLLKFVVEHIPILQKTIGLASVSFICALLVYWKLIPEESVGIVKNVISGTDFLGFFVCALLCGSVIGMDRKILIKAGARYFIPVMGGIVFAYGLGALAGICLGYDWREVLLYIAGPIMGGGNGAGAVPMSRIYAAASGLGAEDMYSKLLPAITLGNWIAIFSAIGLKCLGDRIPSLTGNGDVMVLTAADRMELMCFAQISSRLGGAIILIIQSILASALL